MITVYCGNGGDWEYLRDSAYWAKWITTNICSPTLFEIRPHKDGDRANIFFIDSQDEIVFRFKAPDYITHELAFPDWAEE